MMRPAGITVTLAIYWLAGVVGAASLPPGDQYSPQPSPYRRDVAHGPRGYPNWLQYRRDPSTEFDPPENKPGEPTLRASDLSWESKVRKDTVIRDPDLSASSPGGWNVATAGVNNNFTDRARSDLDVPEDSDISSDSREGLFVGDDTFQDQGPGSVEVYKLDLLRESALLVPEAKKKQRQLAIKSKIPKKAPAEEILWKLKPIEPSKVSFPAIFRQPPRLHSFETLNRETSPKTNEDRKDEVFAVGGVPELQVGCEGLEASDRRRRSSDPGEGASDENSENWQKFNIPVYQESTEPLLSRVTPIVLDFEEEPPSGEVYEEMDELLKLKNLESTSPAPTTRRRSRADIDPALAIHHPDELTNVETFPERGDLGPVTNGSSKVKRSIRPEGSQASLVEGARDRRENDAEDDDTSSATVGSPAESSTHHGGRKLLWTQYPKRQELDNRARSRHHRAVNERQHGGNDLWGFGEDDGVISGSEDESEAEQLRKVEMEKRRREYERRKQEELERRRGHGHHRHRQHSQEHHSRNGDADSEIERIRMEYERQLEEQQRDRQRIENERRSQGGRRHWDEERRRTEEANRRQEEESRRRMDEEDERNYRNRPSPLTRPEQPHRADNRSRSQEEDREAEERKLREYIERNRPIDPKSREDRRRPEEQSRWRDDDGERRRHMEEERRREQIEEHRRRQQQPDEDERRRQMEEHRRRQHERDEEERRREMEEHRRRQQQPDEEKRHRQMEEHRRRQQQRDEEERRRQMEEHKRRQQQPDEEERRRQMEGHGRRQQHQDEYERRRQMEEQRRRQQPDGEERRREMEELRRRDRPDNRTTEEERRLRLEEERKLRDYVRRNQPVNVPRRNNSEIFTSQERDSDEQRRTLEAARQYERNRALTARTNEVRSHGPSAPANSGHRQSHSDLEEIRRRQEADSERRRIEDEERRREEEYRRAESRRREEDRQRLEAMRRNEENGSSQSEVRRPSWQDSGSSRRPANTPHRGSASGEVRDREAAELRRREAAERTSARNPENEWKRRSEERDRQRQKQEERERVRMENERNSRNNGRRRPQQEDTGFKENRHRGESVRSLDERRRREHARLSSLPVSASIIIRSNDGSRPTGASEVTTLPTPLFDTRGNFDNGIDFPAINPHRQGLAAGRFPAPATRRPPVKSPGACVWAIVQCCPTNNRLTTCFESMGCPGINWDPSPCRGSLADAARAEVVRFYEAADEERRRP